MATIRKRKTKNGITYDIQVKIKDKGSGQEIVRTTTWKPESSMTPKQEDKAVTVYADKFEEEIRDMLNSGTSAIENPNVTFREFAAQWLEKILHLAMKDETYSLNYYEKCRTTIDDVNKFIGGYKLKDLTPAIIQAFYNKLDMREKTVYKITPKPDFRAILTFYGYDYNRLRYEKKVQSCTLAGALKGKTVSKQWAVNLSEKTGISYEELFTEVETKEPYAHETIHQIKRTIRAILSQAKKNRLVTDNYATAQYIDFPPKPDTEIVCMDDENAQEFFKAVSECTDIRIKTAMLIFIMTGLRRGEVTGLQWKRIDLERHTLTVYRTVTTVRGHGKVIKNPKTKKSKRTFTIPTLLVEVLTEYKDWWNKQTAIMGDLISDDDDWLFFQNDGKVVYPGIFGTWLKQILNTAGLEHCTLHSLRHTNITMQIAAGVPIVTVSARAGHARTSTTSDIYAHFIRSSDVAAAETLDNIFTAGKQK